MNRIPFIVIAIAATLAGCSKKEEPATTVAQAVAEPSVTEEVQPAAEVKKAENALPGLKNELTANVDQAMGAAMKMASSVDWTNLSWDKVADVPFDDKAKLLAWAAPQIDKLKDQLTKAAMTKGAASLAGLGDSGWQSTLKSVVEALDAVRNSSPETWEMAKGALMSAWTTLQAEAAKQL